MLNAGSFKLTNQLGAGWGGEAFGKQQCAMTIEGNWIAGAMTHDYPTVGYRVAELPAGPAGKGTMQYDGGWGLAEASKNKPDALKLIANLTARKVQMGNARAFGVMPSSTANQRCGASSTRSRPRSWPARATREAFHPFPTSQRCRGLQSAAAGAADDGSEEDPGPRASRAPGDPEQVDGSQPTSVGIARRGVPPAGEPLEEGTRW